MEDIFNCMHMGELLLGAMALLVLLIVAGAVAALLLCQLQSDRPEVSAASDRIKPE